jgi:hypothetical protein
LILALPNKISLMVFSAFSNSGEPISKDRNQLEPPSLLEAGGKIILSHAFCKRFLWLSKLTVRQCALQK